MFVEFAFLFFGGYADLVFHRRIANCDEVPRLQIRSARRTPGHAQAIFDHVARDCAGGEIAHSATPLHLFRKGMRTFSHLVVGKHFAWGERNESRVVHASAIVIRFLV